MAKVAPYQGDFGTGEVSQLVAGRTDADRYKSALELCQNFFPTSQGALVRRSGTKFIAEVKDSTKVTILIPFEFSVDQAYILELGHQYMRVYANYGQVMDPVTPANPYEVATLWYATDLALLDWVQSGDVLYVTHPVFPPTKITRLDDDDWTVTFVPLLDGPYMDIDNRGYTLTPSAATGVVTVTTGPSLSVAGATSSGGLINIQINSHGKKTGESVFLAAIGGTTEANGEWAITVVDDNHFTLDGSAFVHAYTAGGTCLPALFVFGDYGRLVRMQQGSIWGWGAITTVTDGAHVTVSVGYTRTSPSTFELLDRLTTLTNTTAKTQWRLGAYSGVTGYPAAVAFHEDRLFIGGCTEFPQRSDGSRSADYENFSPTDSDGTVPSDAAISFTLNQGGVDRVNWYSSDEQGLLIGTAGGEYWLKASSQYEAISATNIGVKKSTSYGGHDTKPVQAGKATIYVQRAQRKIMELAYFYEVNGFRSTNMSILAEHITLGGITALAYQKEPHPVVWAIRADGTLLGMSYDRDLDNLRVGWHKHPLGGVSDADGTSPVVESIACIPSPDGSRADLWMVVQRHIDGGAVRYVEYMTAIFDDSLDIEDAFFVDCGLTYDGAANDVISGLDHLEGEVVSALGDGAVYEDLTVTGGEITLPRECSTVHIGYPFTSRAKLMRIDAGAQNGTSIGKKRKINGTGVMLYRSGAFRIGMSFEEMKQLTFRKPTDPANGPVPLRSGIIYHEMAGDYDTEGQICVEQSRPLPLTIQAIMPQLTTQDGQ